MKGFTLKATVVTTVWFSASLLTPLVFATDHKNDIDKMEMFNSGAGCMACHQGEETQFNETGDINHANQYHQKRIKTATPVVKQGAILKKL